MKNLLKKRKRLFDGENDDFYTFACSLNAPVPGGGQLLFDNRQTRYLWELGEPMADKLVAAISGAKKIVDFPGDTPSYKQDNLTLYWQQAADESSGENFLIVVAAGELQPARYAIYLAGILQEP